jgi:hypothetical protein
MSLTRNLSKEPDPTRRIALLALAVAPLAACSSSDSTEYGALGNAIKVELGLMPPPSITLQEAAGIPYSTLGFRIGNGGQTMLVLASANGDSLIWTASNRVSFLTKGGRIKRSAGFKWNLSDEQFLEPDPVAVGLQKSIPAQPIQRVADFHDISRFGVPIAGTFKGFATDEVTILGQPLKTIAVTEICKCDSIDWNFENTFWADPDTGFIWKSIQNIHPNLDPITVEILRPPA